MLALTQSPWTNAATCVFARVHSHRLVLARLPQSRTECVRADRALSPAGHRRTWNWIPSRPVPQECCVATVELGRRAPRAREVWHVDRAREKRQVLGLLWRSRTRGGPRRLYSAAPLSGHPRRVCATATRRRDAIAHTTTDERHRPTLLLSFAFHGPRRAGRARPGGGWAGWRC